jgi:hypothetical protein
MRPIQPRTFGYRQCCQHTTYSAELVNLTTKNGSRLLLVKQLRLFLDQHLIIRCGGRIHNAPISQVSNFATCRSPFHNLDHPLYSHCSTAFWCESTLTALRDRFWIPRARQVIKKLLRKCVVCRK